MARARSTFGKLQRDQAKKDRAKAKMDDRQIATRGQGGRERPGRRPPLPPTTSTRPSCSSSSPRCTRTWPRAGSRSTTSRSAKRSCAPSSSSDGCPARSTPGLSSKMSYELVGVAPLEPAPEPGRVRVDPVHDVQLLLVRGVDVAEQRVESGRERVGDVGPLAVGLLRRLGPLAQRLLRLGQQLLGLLEQPVVRQGDARRACGRRTWPASAAPGPGRSRAAASTGRRTPPSGSLTPTASPAKSTPLNESCRPRWCLA